MTRTSQLLRLTVAAFALAVVVAAAAVWHFVNWADSELDLREPVVFVLPAGATFRTFAAALHTAGVTNDTFRLSLLARTEGVATSLQAGEYLFEPGLTPRTLLRKVVIGDVLLHPVRIVEGSTTRDLLSQLAADGRLTHTLDGVEPGGLVDALGLDWPYAEGIFFPDTYLVRRGDADRSVLLRAHAAMLEHLQALIEQSGLLSREDALTLASIIEKETGREEDRATISQVFHKRLAEGIPLQTDPTVIYALGEAFDGNLKREHLRIDSPYNTYRYKGLPPGPIALPSRASIEAALNPADSSYLYFVSRGDGTTQFSKTLAEHNAAVRRFQLGRAQ